MAELAIYLVIGGIGLIVLSLVTWVIEYIRNKDPWER